MNVKPRSKKEEQAEATRAALLTAARELFSERGYSGVAMEAVVAGAGVTRGALYHHFADKKDLFRAVYEDVERSVTEQVATQAIEAGSADPWEVTRAGWRAFLRICRDPALSRIAFVDAPSVLGLVEWREIADRYGGALVKANIQALMDAGEIEPGPVEPLARILLGALVESAYTIAEADDAAAVEDEMGEALDRVMEGLRTRR